MADPSNLRENSMRFRKSLSKMAFRNKERVMRSIGRAEETKDEILDHYVMLINKQQIQMQKLQRDMKQYLQALKAMGLAQRAFYTSLYEVYDEGWEGKDVVGSCSKRSEALYEDIFARFQSEVLELLHNHLTEYQKCRVSIEKRGRKLVDYDAAKRAVQALESAKKTDYPKLEKSKESLQQARDVYEDLNNFLHQQLPALHDSRLTVCVNVFSSICESEGVFSSEVAELRTKLNNVLLNLKSSFDNGEYRIQRMQTPLDNGLVPAESESPSTSTASHMKVPPPLPASSSPPKFEKMNPRTQSENGQAKQHDDPSTHEYVNLQVGVMPDTVKPVSEDEEFNTDETSNKKKIEESTYLTPNVHFQRGDSAYIMASDFSYSAQRSEPIGMSLGPRPAVRCHVFRNPSDRRDVRPPIPKPLPRTLSAPPGRRPEVKRHVKGPVSKRYNRPTNPNYTDIHRPFHRHKATNVALEDRPEHEKRPASMYAPAATAGLSVYVDDKGKSKDDGSGNADQKKHKKAQNEEKGQKGFFGRIGLRRFRSIKNLNPAPLSAAEKSETPAEQGETTSTQSKNEKEEKGTTSPAVSGAAVVVASAGATAALSQDAEAQNIEPAGATEGQNPPRQEDNIPDESEYSEIGPQSQSLESSMEENTTKVDETATEISEDEVMNSVSVKYAKIKKRTPCEKEEPAEVPALDSKTVEPSGNSVNANQDEATEVHAEIRRVSIENDPVHSVAVNFNTSTGQVSDNFENDAFKKSEDFEPFGGFDDDGNETVGDGKASFDANLAFGAPDTTEEIGGFQDGFTDSFASPNQLQLEGFSSEPFSSLDESADSALDGDDSVFDPGSPISPDNFAAVTETKNKFDGREEDKAMHGVSMSSQSGSGIPQQNSLNTDKDQSPTEGNGKEFEGGDYYEDMTGTPQKGTAPLGQIANPAIASGGDVHQGLNEIGQGSGDEYYEDMTITPGNGASQPGQNMPQRLVTSGNLQQSVSENGHHVAQTGNDSNDEFYEDMDGTLQRDMNMSGDSEKKVEFTQQEERSDCYATADTLKIGATLEVSGEAKDKKVEEHHYTAGKNNEISGNATGSSNIAPNVVQTQDVASDPEEFYEPVMPNVKHLPKAPATHDMLSMHQTADDSDGNLYEDIPGQGTPTKDNNNEQIDFSENEGFYEDIETNEKSETAGAQPLADDKNGSSDKKGSSWEFPIPGHPQAINDDQLEIPPIYEEPPREEILTKPPSKASDQGKITSFPPNYLFSVKALYQYRSSDDDELSFSKGDIIYIIEHPDPEEQDDGWQMGIRQVDWEQTGQVNSCMGVFPENFTKRIELQ